MQKFEQFELMLVMTIILSIIPCGITYWIFESFIYILIPFLPIVYFSYKYTQNTKNKKEIISIFLQDDTIYFMLGDDNWYTIKINQASDITKAILDKLTTNVGFLKSHIKSINLINIDNRLLQDKLNKLIVS